MRIHAAVLAVLFVAGCAVTPEMPVSSLLEGKDQQERITIMEEECNAMFAKGHIASARPKNTTSPMYRKHTREMKETCREMSKAAQGLKVEQTAKQLQQKCLSDAVVGDRKYYSRNKRHIYRKDEVCNAFYKEIVK